MAIDFDPFVRASVSSATVYELPMDDYGPQMRLRIKGTGFTYDRTTGLLNGGSITSLEIVSLSGPTPELVQTITMQTPVAGSSYHAFLAKGAALRRQVQAWNFDVAGEPNFSSTRIDLAGADGTRIVIEGTGLSPDAMTGTVRSIQHLAANGSVLHRVTGLPASLVDVALAFGGGGEELYGMLTQGVNTVTAHSSRFGSDLDGGAGNDVIIGNADKGGDWMVGFSTAKGGVNVNLDSGGGRGTATGVGIGTDTIFGVNNVLGTRYADRVIGNAADNRLIGEGGNDVLHGRGGNDTLHGGSGNDQLLGGDGNDMIVAGAGDDLVDGGAGIDWAIFDNYSYSEDSGRPTRGVIVDLAITGPQNTGGQGVDTLIGIENVRGSHLDDVLLGNAGQNTLDGGAGNDVLDGRGGNDNMLGGTGNDTYILGTGYAGIVDFGGGIDTVRTAASSFSLTTAQGVENLTFTGSGNFDGGGSERNNTITGGVGKDQLYGLGGNDVLIGGAGDDMLFGDSAIGDKAGTSGIRLGTGVLVHTGAGNNSLERARDVSTEFSLAADPDIEDATVAPHVSIRATGGGAIQYYRFEVRNPGARIIVDIDRGFGTSSEFAGVRVTTAVEIFGPGGSSRGMSLGSEPESGAGGSKTHTDGYFQATADQPGTYTIAVSRITGDYPNHTASGVPVGATYTLNISVDGELRSYDDRLDGGAGNDTLVGGIGNDTMTGGAGNDTFRLAPGSASDRISDFQGGKGAGDLIDLSAYAGFKTFEQVRSRSRQVGTSVVVNLGDGAFLTLENQQLANLAPDDFKLAVASPIGPAGDGR